MRDINKLAKKGWWKAMIHQGTLSLILTLDDLLISGPHLSTVHNKLTVTDQNIFFVKSHPNITENKNSMDGQHMEVSTYYVLRPHIRGILYGLNPLYQISLYAPCKDSEKMILYREIISRIDIGGQFFQDRIYWSYDALKQDVMDSRLACLIYAGNFSLANDWLEKIAIESKPFSATIDVDLTMSDNLFDLVELRSFLEDVHQRYFSLLNESNQLHFADMIRIQVTEKSNKFNIQNDNPKSTVTSTSGFLSGTSSQFNKKELRRFNSEGFSLRNKEMKKKIEFLFKTSNETPIACAPATVDQLLEEYEDIIQEQLEINHDITNVSALKTSFAKTLCRWNSITQRKSDVLRQLMSHDDKNQISERLRQLNSVYCLKKFQSQNDLFTSEQSEKTSVSISSAESVKSSDNMPQFTTWYIQPIKL